MDEPQLQPINLIIGWDELQTLIKRAHEGENPDLLWIEFFGNNYIDQEPRPETDQPCGGRCDCE